MLNNLTTKFQEALMEAQKGAAKLGKPEIAPVDVLIALLEQEGGILGPILRKAACDPNLLLQGAKKEAESEPRQQGATTQPKMSAELSSILQQADKERENLKDDYLSVEHFMLCCFDSDNKVRKLIQTFGLDKANYLAAMKEFRGSQRVSDAYPEDKYQILEK